MVVSSIAGASEMLAYALEPERVSESSETRVRSTARRSSMKRAINIEEILEESNDVSENSAVVSRGYQRPGERSSIVCVDLI